MDVIEGRGVKALVYNPNKYERVIIHLIPHERIELLISSSSANATTRNPTTPSKTCRRKADTTTCSRPVLLRRLIPLSVSMEASRRSYRAIILASVVYHIQLLETVVVTVEA